MERIPITDTYGTERAPVDDGFSFLERRAMALFAAERTQKNVSELLEILHPILDYYIRFYLYRFGIHDSHEDRGDIYGETYVRAVDLLGKIRLEGIVPRGDYRGQLDSGGQRTDASAEKGTANFNRVKRYINKSIGGWIYNRVFKRPKRDIELTKDDLAALVYPDPEDKYGEVETAADIETIEKHLKTETPMYTELCSAMSGARERHASVVRQYRDTVYEAYSETGKLPGAEDVFSDRFGRAFGNI